MALFLLLGTSGLGLAAHGEEAPWLLERLDQRAGAFVSPGALSRAHGELGAVSDCTQCHSGARGTPDALCTECHEAVRERAERRLGWHGRFSGDCASCHREHRGREADLLGLDRERFNHDLARFPLRGAHAGIDCDDCHLQERDGRLGFHPIGISFDRCTSCHADPHGAGFAAERDCADCHGEASFAAEGMRAGGFDHARDTDFALSGAHARVPCAGCHTAERRAAERGAERAPGGDAPRECASCHRDPHAAALGSACGECHATAAWSGEALRFDHAEDTRFALDATHATIACSACHADDSFQAKGRECASCHADAANLLAARVTGAPALAPDVHAGVTACRDCHAANVASPRLTDFERACLGCHPAPYASLLVTRKRAIDERLVALEAALHRRELASRRGDAPASVAAEALRERAQLVERSGLHHPALADALLLDALERLAREGAQP